MWENYDFFSFEKSLDFLEMNKENSSPKEL